MFGYTLDDLRTYIAEWNESLTDFDLSSCSTTGAVYKRAEAELLEALYQAGYTVTLATPIAYQKCHDILTQGVALYYIEGHTGSSYQEGYNPIVGAFSRYRNALRDIASGGQLGELSQKTTHGIARCNVHRSWRCR